MPNKPKTNQEFTPHQIQKRDLFYTPFGATDLTYLNKDSVYYDPCCGDLLMIVDRLISKGYKSFGTDLGNPEQSINIFDLVLDEYKYLLDKVDFIITNPPYSAKKKVYELLKYKLNKPFALLIPTDLNGWLINATGGDGCKWLIPNKRINYITPNILENIERKEGIKFNSILEVTDKLLYKYSNSQFHSGWLTYGVDLPLEFNFVEFTKEQRELMIGNT